MHLNDFQLNNERICKDLAWSGKEVVTKSVMQGGLKYIKYCI